LWLVLTQEQNALGWPATFALSTGYACHLLGGVSENTFRRARAELVENELLIFVSGGKKGKDVSQYTMRQLYDGEPAAGSEAETAPQTAPPAAGVELSGDKQYLGRTRFPKRKTVNDENQRKKDSDGHYNGDVACENGRGRQAFSGGLGKAGNGRERSWTDERFKPI
jgi:hypothetical protein